MIRFEFDRVLVDWWMVTLGRSLDDIEYTVIENGTEHTGGLFRLETLVALYECTLHEIPTKEHPVRGGYRLVRTSDGVALELDGELVPTSYDELQETLSQFLSDVFVALDQKSDPASRKEGIGYLSERDDLLHDFRETYEELTDTNSTN